MRVFRCFLQEQRCEITLRVNQENTLLGGMNNDVEILNSRHGIFIALV